MHPPASLSRNNARRASHLPRDQSIPLLQYRRPSISPHPPSPGCTGKHPRPRATGPMPSAPLSPPRYNTSGNPPGFLPVLGPGPAFRRELLHIPGAFLPAGIARGLWFRGLEFFVITGLDCPGLSPSFSTGSCFQHTFSIFSTGAERARGRIASLFPDWAVPGRDRFSFSADRELCRH